MNIEEELKNLLQNYKIEKKLDNIEDLLTKKDVGGSSCGFWLFAMMAMLTGFGGSTAPSMPTSITNIYQEKETKENTKDENNA